MINGVEISINAEDFEFLRNNSMAWAGHDWEIQVFDGRFEAAGKAGQEPGMHWRRAYWMGPEYTAVILARAFLQAKGFDCEVVFDLAGPGQWMILTDYGGE